MLSIPVLRVSVPDSAEIRESFATRVVLPQLSWRAEKGASLYVVVYLFVRQREPVWAGSVEDHQRSQYFEVIVLLTSGLTNPLCIGWSRWTAVSKQVYINPAVSPPTSCVQPLHRGNWQWTAVSVTGGWNFGFYFEATQEFCWISRVTKSSTTEDILAARGQGTFSVRLIGIFGSVKVPVSKTRAKLSFSSLCLKTFVTVQCQSDVLNTSSSSTTTTSSQMAWTSEKWKSFCCIGENRES